MIQMYADGQLIYDSRLADQGQDYSLLGLRVTTGLNKGGTAEIVMPPGHPAYSQLVGHRTIVELYRDGGLGFRGRALYAADDFFNRRTWTCEGELCFLQDGVSRAYLYQDTPAAIFTKLITDYNDQVEAYKRFEVGDITVTDPNNYVRLESETAEQTIDTVNKLLERCGGYVVFSAGTAGARAINWYADPGFRSGQVIEFGENLLDFARSGANTDLATVIVPYGAKTESGERVTIKSVNNGLDYIQDDDAVALRGSILRPVYWDDVTEPANLLRKAQTYLAEAKQAVTTLTLTALDLARMDKTIDEFRAGDKIRVRSIPHAVDDEYQLTELTDDWLLPANSTVTLGKDVWSLTDADVAGDNKNAGDINRTTNQIRADYNANIANAIAGTERNLSTLIQQTSEAIRTEVAETYTTADESGRLVEQISSQLTQLSDSFEFSFAHLQAEVGANKGETETRFTELYKYITISDDGITIGGSESGITLSLDNDGISFSKNGVAFGRWDGNDFYTGNIVVEVNERAQFGNFAFIPRSDGSLSFLKVGD